MVNVHVPPAMAVTVTLVPAIAVVTIPAHPDATYGPAVPSVIVMVCGFAPPAENDRFACESESATGVGVGVGDADGARDGDGVEVTVISGVVSIDPPQPVSSAATTPPAHQA